MRRAPTVRRIENGRFDSIGDLLIERAGRWPQLPITFDHEETTLSEVVRGAGRLATSLVELGVKRGETVGIMLPNGVEFLQTWFATMLIGAIEVPMSVHAKGPLLEHFLNVTQPTVMVADTAYLDVLGEPAGRQGVRTIVAVGAERQSEWRWSMECVLWEDALAGSEFEARPQVRRSDPAAILFTSGTTGPSKGVTISHNMGIWTGDQAATVCDLQPHDVWYSCLPFFHIDSQFVVTMSALLVGAKLTISPRFSVTRFWDDIERLGATRFMFIGAILEMLLKRDTRRLTRNGVTPIGMGAPVRSHVHRPFEERFGCRLIDTFGMTEIGTPVWNPLGDERLGAAGLVSGDYDVKLVDDDDEEVPVGQPGELLIRPLRPFTLFSGYYGMPDATVESWRNLWFHTGDLVRLDADGYVYFVDRKKDSLRRRGENVSASELETIVTSHEEVEACAAVSVQSDLSEEDIRIFVVPTTGSALTERALEQFCVDQMPYFMVPRYFDFCASLPMTATSKIDKPALRATQLGAQTWDRETATPREVS